MTGASCSDRSVASTRRSRASVGGLQRGLLTRHRPEMLSPFARRNPPSWVATAARLGHLSTGTVHCLVGALAITAALDPQARATGSQGALHELATRPFGTMLLIGLGLGLLVDSFWQGVRAG